MFVPVFGEVEEGGAAGDEGGVYAEFLGAGVAALLKVGGAAFMGVAHAAKGVANGLG